MLPCPVCTHLNPPESPFCSHCGALLDSLTVAQQAIQSGVGSTPDEVKHLLGLQEDRTCFGEHSQVVLFTRHAAAPIDFSLRSDTAVILGRLSSQLVGKPLVDLTVFGAYKYGVSRLHAELSRGNHTLRITDLESTNGTFVNGLQLLPREQRGLSSGDVLQLGNLIMRVVFRHPD